MLLRRLTFSELAFCSPSPLVWSSPYNFLSEWRSDCSSSSSISLHWQSEKTDYIKFKLHLIYRFDLLCHDHFYSYIFCWIKNQSFIPTSTHNWIMMSPFALLFLQYQALTLFSTWLGHTSQLSSELQLYHIH